MNLCDSAYCTAWIAVCHFLLDGYCRWYAFYKIYIGFLHTPKKLARIRTKALYITPLTFGKQCVEGQRRLAATAHSRDYHQLVAGDIYGNVFQVMRACPVNMDYILIQVSIINCQLSTAKYFVAKLSTSCLSSGLYKLRYSSLNSGIRICCPGRI